MDPIGGINPSNPRLDSASPAPAAPPAPSAPITAPTLETPAPSAPAPVQLPNEPVAPTPMPSGGIDLPPPKGSSGVLKKVLIGLLGLVLVAALAGGGYFVGYAAGKSKGRTEADAEYQRKQAQLQQEEAESEAAETEEDAAAQLQLGDLVEPKYIDETIEGEIGKQVSASDGFVLKVTNIERNFKAEDPNYKLDASKELVKVNFLIGNVTKDKAKDISSFNFRLENAANAQLTPENIASYADKFDTVKLDPGAQAKGSIVYAVNKDEAPLKFVREQRYRISSENREVTTKISITLVK